MAHCAQLRRKAEFVSSVNITDIHTTWTETFAVLGKGRHGVTAAIDEMRKALPFPLRGIDSRIMDREFINHHLYDYCQEKRRSIHARSSIPEEKTITLTSKRQKNWTARS